MTSFILLLSTCGFEAKNKETRTKSLVVENTKCCSEIYRTTHKKTLVMEVSLSWKTAGCAIVTLTKKKLRHSCSLITCANVSRKGFIQKPFEEIYFNTAFSRTFTKFVQRC